MRNLLINFGLLVSTILIFFLGIEFALRITGIQTIKPNPPLIFQTSANSKISYELKPNMKERAYRSTVTTNSLGFRSKEIDKEKSTIVVLGDSITFGYGLEDDETIPAHLDNLLEEYNVLNTAAPGYNLFQETAIYKEISQELDPKRAILIFHFNDITSETAFLHEDGTLRSPGWKPTGAPECDPIKRGPLGLIPGKCWLDTHSAFYKFTKKIVNLRYGKAEQKKQQMASEEESIDELESQEEIDKYLEDLTNLTGILPPLYPRIFVIWPDRFMHEESRIRLRNGVEREGFTVIDMYEFFGNEVETLSWDTVHPSAATAKKAAEIIAEVINKEEPF
jgi:lysophospholipase L1-like esterase